MPATAQLERPDADGAGPGAGLGGPGFGGVGPKVQLKQNSKKLQ